MLPWLIYRDLLHGSEPTQQASRVHSTGHSHEADSISEVHLAPHANGDLSPNGAGARVGEARSKPAVVINFGSVWLVCSARLRCAIPQGSHGVVSI